MRKIIVCALCMLAGTIYASEREIASNGKKLQLLIDADYQCRDTVPIRINTSSAAYYDQDATTIQRLVINTAGAVLGFECPKASHLQFFGYTDGVLLFRADAQKRRKWAIASYPPPLETLALFFGLREPAFSHLGTISDQLQQYQHVSGITETHQYKAFQQQAQRLASVVDGDTEKFIAYLKNPGHEFKTFEAAKAHYTNVLNAITLYAPEHHSSYLQAYDNVEGALKDEFWSSKIASIIADGDTVSDIVKAAKNAAIESNSDEFRAYVDDHIAAWFEEDADLIAADIPSAPLYEVAFVSDYLAEFPAPSEASGLPETTALLDTIPGNLLPLTLDRLATLQASAMNTVKQSGSNYGDADSILETGFAIAEEFEGAGYPEEAEALIASTLGYIGEMLSVGLEDYRQELRAMEFSGESVAALQQQALIFAELSADIEGFKGYQLAAEETLEQNKTTICQNIAGEAGIDAKYFDTPIDTSQGAVPLIHLACRLFENQHQVSSFEPTGETGTYLLEVTQDEGEKHRFVLSNGSESAAEALTAVKRLKPEETVVTPELWHDYVANLLEPPPGGEPDPQGVRECDRLAADPYDANKLAPGVDFETEEVDPENFDRALDACIAAIEHAPDDARQHFQLGRLLWYAGDQEGATQFVVAAAEAGYAPAIYYQAEILLGTSEDPDAFIDALDLFETAGNAGYPRGAAMVKELNPEGLDFFKEIPPPTVPEIISALKVQKVSKSMLGVTTTGRVVNIRLKDCFQTSATDFSCEYRKILKCGMSGWGNDPVIRMMSWAIQKDCDATQYTFGSFRKLDEGKWKELPDSF